MKAYLRELWDLLQASNWRGRLNLVLYAFEIVIYRAFGKRIRQSLHVRLYDHDFLVKTHNIDLGIIHEVFGKGIYEALPRFVARQGDTCLDIGAHIGCVSLQWARCNSSGHILAIEPHPETFVRLRTNLAANHAHNVTPLQCAASHRSGDLLLEVADSTGMARIEGAPTGDRAYKGSSTILVRAYSIDDLVANHGLRKVDLMKVDVEGCEADCLRGATKVLEKTDRVIVEYHSEALRKECWAILSEARFRLEEVGNLIFGQRDSEDDG